MVGTAEAGAGCPWVLLAFCLLGATATYVVLALNKIKADADQKLLAAFGFGVFLGSLWWRFALPGLVREVTSQHQGTSVPGGLELVLFILVRLLLGFAHLVVLGGVVFVLSVVTSWPLRRVTGLAPRRSVIVAWEIFCTCPAIFTIATAFGLLASGTLGS